ncbi:MAG: TolC family protein [Deltaproteobacteria bacterium]|jgi:outer membrane protein TolC|nr:TolC family protein [Deltaproteobacteria bacterium]MBW2542783.1 TolC family protein [Deltaproteobacteria bacterium]
MSINQNRVLRSCACALAINLFVAHGAIARAMSPLQIPDPLPLDWCLDRANVANPSLEASSAEADAVRASVGSAGRLEDPRFGYEAVNLPTGDFDLDSTPMSGHQLSLQQKLPIPGLLSGRKAAAHASAEAAEAAHEDRRMRLASDIERAWSSLAFAQRALEITDKNLVLLRQLREIAETKYRVGSGLQQDVLRAQVQLTTLLGERLRREALLKQSEAALAALLDLPGERELPRTEELDQQSAIPALTDLLARIDAASPLLRERRARIEAAEKRVRTAELEGYPDVDLRLGYRIREDSGIDPVDGQDFLSAGFTLRLPVDRGKWTARVAEERARLRKAKAEYRAALAALADEIKVAHSQLVQADAEVELLVTGLLPQAHQSLESSRSGYQVARIDFLSLLDSEVRLYEAELRLVRARASRRASFAQLEASVGEVLR